MANVTRGRIVFNNQTILDQSDFFQNDGFTRVTGLTVAQVTSELFFNNVLQPWILVTGNGVSNTQVTSGKVYFEEIPGSSGFYNVRFRPNMTGYWRLLIRYPAGLQIQAQDYDVVAGPSSTDTGLKVSLTKPGC